METLWAMLDNNNVVIGVQSATAEWVSAWERDNPKSEVSYLETSLTSRDYPGVGWSHDDTLDRFIPPMPDMPGDWYYDEDGWEWIDRSAPPLPPPDEEEAISE